MEISEELKQKAVGFLKGVGENDRVALISHTDLDGLASAKVVEKVLSLDFLDFINYTDFDESYVKKLESEKITKVIFTDVDVSENSELVKEIEKFADVLIMDHHMVKEDLNSEKTIFVSVQGFCGAQISYEILSEIKDISELDWLVACACVSDFQYFKNRDFMKKVYEKYDEYFDSSNYGIKQSDFWIGQLILSKTLIYFDPDLKKAYELIPEKFDDLIDLKKYSQVVDEEINKCLDDFENDKETYGDLYFWEFNPQYKVKSIVSNILSKREPNKTFLFISPRDDRMTISVRRQDGEVNLVELLEKLLDGFENANSGGHFKAAGGFFEKKDLDEFRKRVAKLG